MNALHKQEEGCANGPPDVPELELNNMRESQIVAALRDTVTDERPISARRNTDRGTLDCYDAMDDVAVYYDEKEYIRVQRGNTINRTILTDFAYVTLFGYNLQFLRPVTSSYSRTNYFIYCLSAFMPIIIFSVQLIYLMKLEKLGMTHAQWIFMLFAIYEFYAILNSVWICPLFIKLNQTFKAQFRTEKLVLLRIIAGVMFVLFPWAWLLSPSERYSSGPRTIELKTVITLTCMLHYVTLLYMMFNIAQLMKREVRKSLKKEKNIIRMKQEEYWYMRPTEENEDAEMTLLFRRLRVYTHYKNRLVYFLIFSALAFVIAFSTLVFIVVHYGRVGVLESLYSSCCMIPLIAFLIMINEWNTKIKQFEEEKNIDTGLLVKLLWIEINDRSLLSVAFFVLSYLGKVFFDVNTD